MSDLLLVPVGSSAWLHNSSFQSDAPVQLAWDSTSLRLMMECPRKYYYTMIEGWRAKHESVHLTFGLLYHAALEEYDRARALGLDHTAGLRSAVRLALSSSKDFRSDLPQKNRLTLIRSIVWYLDAFPAETDPAKTVILANGQPAVELSFRLLIPGTELTLCGHLDRLVEYAQNYYWLDHKTTKSTLSAEYFLKYSPDAQVSLYTVGGQIVYGHKLLGGIIDAAQLAVNFTRFLRGFTHRTPGQLDEWLGNAKQWIDLAHHYAQQEDSLETSAWPMNEMSCDKFNGCPFRSVCSRDPAVREIYLQADFHKVVWDPLRTREV